MKNAITRFYDIEDPFSDSQPERIFDDLKSPVYGERPKNWHKRNASTDEATVCNVAFEFEFPDNENLLETAYNDLDNFVSVHCGKGNEFIIRIQSVDNFEEEQFRISVSTTECVIFSSDTEGIRRGIYFIEDEMIRRGGPFLPLGDVERTPHIKRRISRNYFTPHQANKELLDDIDYYPDEYLSRLAHDGVNGLWIFLQLRGFIPSDIVPEYGKGGKPLIEKLRSIAKKCARYGIRIYGLGVEPASSYDNKILQENHTDMLGAKFWNSNLRAICPSTEKGAAYTEECMYNLFRYVPELSGFISITSGEAVAGCGSVGNAEEINCPNCRAAGLTKPEALAKTEMLMQRGVKRAKPDAEFISWTYAARSWSEDMIKEHCDARDNSIPLMNNFEDKGVKNQLGKDRITLDYWLSYPGPGKLFEFGAQNSNGAPLYAKIQVCCSHEIATVPYVPVPGVLYEKYSEMKKHNTVGVQYCWFMGNYPGMMNKAAGELGFLPFPETKEEFLYKLALLYTEPENVENLLSAWNLFEKGYSMCPYNVLFAWFGPLNDAPARPLHLIPIDASVPSNWIITQSSEGDRFGEFVGMMHTPDEVKKLLSEFKLYWKQGLDFLEKVYTDNEMLNIAKAILILVESSYNIFEFYILRNKLGYCKDKPLDILSKMEDIAISEIKNSVTLSELCKTDNRLGYHGEAVGFKFFSEKLNWRVERVKQMLSEEFAVVRNRVAAGKMPLSFFDGENGYVYPIEESPWENFTFKDGSQDDKTSIRIYDKGGSYSFEIKVLHGDDIFINAEFEMFVPYVPVKLHNGSLAFHDPNGYYLTEEDANIEMKKWQCGYKNGIYKLVIKKDDFALTNGKPFRMAVRRRNDKLSSWKWSDREFFRLAYNAHSPDEKVFIKAYDHNY